MGCGSGTMVSVKLIISFSLRSFPISCCLALLSKHVQYVAEAACICCGFNPSVATPYGSPSINSRIAI